MNDNLASNIILKGCLKKKSPKGISGLRAWQKRYFFLLEGQLAYAKQDDVGTIQGSIPLSEVTSIEQVQNKPTRIRLEVSNRRFDLDAGSAENADNWTAALNRCWVAAKEKQSGSPALSQHSTSTGKFWKASSSGTLPSLGLTVDNLSAPSISTGLNSKAFTPIRMTSLLNESGYFGTVRRRSAHATQLKSRGSYVSTNETLFLDNDSTTQSHYDFSSHVSELGTPTPASPMANLIKSAMKRSQSINHSLTLFHTDSIKEFESSDFGYADFERGDKVADCSIGSLHRANLRETGQSYLLQVVMKREENFDKGAMLIKLMSKAELHHPFFTELVFSGNTPDRAWAAYSFVAPNSTLFDKLRTAKRLPEEQACTYLSQVVMFSAFLHQTGRLFRNMKPEYIGLDASDHIMVLDLEGIAFSSVKNAEHEHLPSGDVFDEFWTPELISGRGETIVSDWWRLGSLLYELMVGFPPFRAKSRDELISKTRDGSLRFPPFVSEDAQDFIQGCLIQDPNHRLGVEIGDILTHKFFRNVDWASMHWKGIIKSMSDMDPEPPVRVKIRVRDGIDFPEGSLEPAICVTYGSQSWSTLPDMSRTSTPSWNTKFEFTHDAFAASCNALLKVEVCTGQVPLASAFEIVDLRVRGCQKRTTQVRNSDGIQIGIVSFEVKVKDTVGKHAQELRETSKKILKRSVTSGDSLKSGGKSRRSSGLVSLKPHRRASILQDMSDKLSGKIRSLVSKNKHRFQIDGFDLDLTYLTPHMIVMGFPSSNLEGVYRNPMEEVQRFVKTYHDNHCRVINLCSERSYDPACFDHNVASFPFEDHTPPPIKLIVDFCRDVKAYLDAHPDNVVATHCKAGKGRTGVMVAAFLLYAGLKPSASEALEFFGEKRTADGKGVTIPSQIRAVHTFEKYLRQTAFDTKPFQFDNRYQNIVLIRISPEPDLSPLGGCDPFCRVYRTRNLIYDSLISKVNVTRPGKDIVDIPIDCVVNGDIKISVYHKTATGKKIMFSFWLNIDFTDNNHITIEKNGLDKADKNSKFDPNFRVELFLKSAEHEKIEVIENLDRNSDDDATEEDSVQSSTNESIKLTRSISEGTGDLYSKFKKRSPSHANAALPDLHEDEINDDDELDFSKSDQLSNTSNLSHHTDSLRHQLAESSPLAEIIDEELDETEVDQNGDCDADIKGSERETL